MQVLKTGKTVRQSCADREDQVLAFYTHRKASAFQ
jgi:hypothetical protein